MPTPPVTIREPDVVVVEAVPRVSIFMTDVLPCLKSNAASILVFISMTVACVATSIVGMFTSSIFPFPPVLVSNTMRSAPSLIFNAAALSAMTVSSVGCVEMSIVGMFTSKTLPDVLVSTTMRSPAPSLIDKELASLPFTLSFVACVLTSTVPMLISSNAPAVAVSNTTKLVPPAAWKLKLVASFAFILMVVSTSLTSSSPPETLTSPSNFDLPVPCTSRA